MTITETITIASSFVRMGVAAIALCAAREHERESNTNDNGNRNGNGYDTVEATPLCCPMRGS